MWLSTPYVSFHHPGQIGASAIGNRLSSTGPLSCWMNDVDPVTPVRLAYAHVFVCLSVPSPCLHRMKPTSYGSNELLCDASGPHGPDVLLPSRPTAHHHDMLETMEIKLGDMTRFPTSDGADGHITPR